MLLITGATGFVGQYLTRHLNNTGIDYLGLGGPASSQTRHQAIDLRDAEAVTRLVAGRLIDGVVHLAAESRTGICQASPDVAQQANVTATQNLLNAVPASSWFLYVSTDMVFSGRRGNYAPGDVPDPINEYGKSKRAAEERVLARGPNSCILRPALIYGAPASGRRSMLSWLYGAISQNHSSFFSDEFRSPVFVEDLAHAIIELYRRRAEGLFHGGGPERLSRWQMALQLAAAYNLPLNPAQQSSLADHPELSWRPADLSMDSSATPGASMFLPFEAALRRLAAAKQPLL